MKNAVVTGASRGIGRRVAMELAKRGYHVFVMGRDLDALAETAQLVDTTDGSAEIVSLDLLEPKSIVAATESIKSSTNHIDVLANVAGMYHDENQHFFDISFADYPDHAIIQNINSSLVGHVLLTKHLLPLLTDGSCVMNTSGTFGEGETGVISDYLTKKGVEIFSQQLALELKEQGVRSNCVRLGFVFTENVQKFFPTVTSDEALDPVSVAKQIVEIAEDRTINGRIVDIKL